MVASEELLPQAVLRAIGDKLYEKVGPHAPRASMANSHARQAPHVGFRCLERRFRQPQRGMRHVPPPLRLLLLTAAARVPRNPLPRPPAPAPAAQGGRAGGGAGGEAPHGYGGAPPRAPYHRQAHCGVRLQPPGQPPQGKGGRHRRQGRQAGATLAPAPAAAAAAPALERTGETGSTALATLLAAARHARPRSRPRCAVPLPARMPGSRPPRRAGCAAVPRGGDGGAGRAQRGLPAPDRAARAGVLHRPGQQVPAGPRDRGRAWDEAGAD
jgi:hypothetical protein